MPASETPQSAYKPCGTFAATPKKIKCYAITIKHFKEVYPNRNDNQLSPEISVKLTLDAMANRKVAGASLPLGE